MRRLIARGAGFDHDADGSLSLTREEVICATGWRRCDRSRGLARAARPSWATVDRGHRNAPRPRPAARRRRRLGGWGEGSEEGVGAALGRAVVLATGGLGLFSQTTGGGVALAPRRRHGRRHGVQYRSTRRCCGSGPHEVQQRGVCEASRGKTHSSSTTLWRPVHARAGAEASPRAKRRGQGDAAHARDGLTPRLARWPRRCGRTASRRSSSRASRTGSTPCTTSSVAPAAHYASGGVRTDLDGRTSVHGLSPGPDSRPTRVGMPRPRILRAWRPAAGRLPG